ncbi:MAG: arginine--tRNA ligase [Candidatus Rokubacteria bacterium]|nr:arginine--tRNA ligase [Candidatus Rokubacteria bacterium]
MAHDVLETLSEGVRVALARAGLAGEEVPEIVWEIPREPSHGDYATNAAMLLARRQRRSPRQVAEAIREHLPALEAIERAEVGGPGFLNVFLAPGWCYRAMAEVLQAGAGYGTRRLGAGERVQVEFVSANPTGPLVVVNARAAAVGDALARILEAVGYAVQREFYVNDAGNQFLDLARAMECRLRQALGEPAELPEGAYPGEYVSDLAREYLAEHGGAVLGLAEAERLDRLGRFAVERIVAEQREVLRQYGVEYDCWFSERVLREAHDPERAVELLREKGYVYEEEGAVWFRSTAFGDEKDRVLVKSDGELTYFVPDIAYHLGKFRRGFTKVIDLWGPDHHGYVPRMQAALRALGYPEGALEVLIVQLVRLLRAGEPVRMSKRRGEFVTMAELIEEVGRDAARFTFLTRRHDSPLDFDLELVTQQSAENPVYYVQYAYARIASIFGFLRERRLEVPEWSRVRLERLELPEEVGLIKKVLQYPDVVLQAARALEPHRIAYYLQELAAAFHAYYNRHRVVTDDLPLTHARLALVHGVGLVLRNGLGLLGVSAPEKM